MYWSENKKRLDKLTADLQRYNPGKQIPILFTYFPDTSNTESTLEKVNTGLKSDVMRCWPAVNLDTNIFGTRHKQIHQRLPLFIHESTHNCHPHHGWGQLAEHTFFCNRIKACTIFEPLLLLFALYNSLGSICLAKDPLAKVIQLNGKARKAHIEQLCFCHLWVSE